MHYLSGSNSRVNVRIGKHTRKGKGLILRISDRACKIQPLDCKLHRVLFSLLSFIQDAVSDFCKLQKKAH